MGASEMKKYFCDKCGEEIEDKCEVFTIKISRIDMSPPTYVGLEQYYGTREVCYDCTKLIDEFMRKKC